MSGLLFGPPILLMIGFAVMMFDDFEGHCLPDGRPCEAWAFLLTNVVANPFIFTMWAGATGLWCLLVTLGLLVAWGARALVRRLRR